MMLKIMRRNWTLWWPIWSQFHILCKNKIIENVILHFTIVACSRALHMFSLLMIDFFYFFGIGNLYWSYLTLMKRIGWWFNKKMKIMHFNLILNFIFYIYFLKYCYNIFNNRWLIMNVRPAIKNFRLNV